VYASAEADFPAQPQRVRDLVSGYAAGINKYLTDAGDGVEGFCAGEPWVGPVSATDLFAYYIDLAVLASSKNLIDYIGVAIAPGSGDKVSAPPFSGLAFREAEIGSNGWGIGAGLSASGRGMIMGNPHFPWEGELRLWESHLTIPGELNIYGASLLGVPGVLIGFNEAVAWTHTVSAGHRFTAYKLELSPDDPTVYIVDGEERAMTSSDYSVDVLQEDGTLAAETRTLWRTDWGPMISIVGSFDWTTSLGLTYRDGNLSNRTLISQFLDMNASTSMDEFQQAHATNQGIPWVNTISADKEGLAWYADATPSPNLSSETIDWWLDARENDFVVSNLWSNGVVCLDGSTSRDEWVEVEGAREPGLVPFSAVPKLERDDFVFNANDSYWMTNPSELLEEFSPMHGEEQSPRSQRTRMNAVVLTEGSVGFSGDDGKFSLAEMEEAALSNRAMTAELLRDQVIAHCTGQTEVVTEAGQPPVQIAQACQLVADWDLRFDVPSVGAIVWREFIGDFNYGDLLEAGGLFASAFDVNDPVNTPNTLTPYDPADSRVLRAMGRAVTRLETAGIPLDAALGDVQFTKKGDQTIPMHGGNERTGVTNKIEYSVFQSSLEPGMGRGQVINGATDLTDEGYVINYGTSFIMAMEFTDDGPHAEAFLTYSQSGVAGSEHSSDQTGRFSEKQWRQCLFTEEEITADPNFTSYTVRASR
jgi:acyl-homoserine-lactone acylase